jgi:hypothetical protein
MQFVKLHHAVYFLPVMLISLRSALLNPVGWLAMLNARMDKAHSKHRARKPHLQEL